MKIKLSKTQWEGIGKKAGWIKLAQGRMDRNELENDIDKQQTLEKTYRTRALEELFTSIGGNRFKSSSGDIKKDHVEIRTETLGTAYIQVSYDEGGNAIRIEKYYDNETLQNEYGEIMNLPFKHHEPDKSKMIDNIKRIINEMK
jgi:hypothetical protein